MKLLWQSIMLTIVFTVMTGVIYPLVITGISQVAFHDQANGSLLVDRAGTVRGSKLLAQNFSGDKYFQPRPSAAGNGYDPTASGGSNYGPTNKKLIDRVQASVDQFRKDNPDYHGAIPADLLTASASGLDPHISPDSAIAQVPRVAKARGVTPDRINTLVASLTEGPDLGVLGEPRVNVLKLNMELDRQYPHR